jgi:hypothetical protein
MSPSRAFLQDAVIYPTIAYTDHRGQVTSIANMDDPLPVKAAFVSNTGATVSMHINPLPPGLDMSSRVWWDGGLYNAGPPAYHNGATRHTRYWAVELKRTS